MTHVAAEHLGETYLDVRRALAGSQGGLGALDRRFRARLEIRFAAWMSNPARFRQQLHRRIGLDDVVQETLRRAFEDLGQLTDVRTGSFWKWLCKIGHSVMMSAIREATAKRRDVRREQPGQGPSTDGCDAMVALPSAAPTPTRRMLELDLHVRLGEAIEALGAREAFVIKQIFLGGSTLDHVAEILGVSRVRVHQIKVRALGALKRSLGGSAAFGLLRPSS